MVGSVKSGAATFLARHGTAIAELHTFEWALIQMKAGKKVRRACWKPHEWWALHEDGVIVLHDGDLVLEIPTIQALASDWCLYEGEEA